MKLRELDAYELSSRLKNNGISITSGPINFNIRSTFPSVSESLALMYGDHPLVGAGEFIDFYTEIKAPVGLENTFVPNAAFTLMVRPRFFLCRGSRRSPLLSGV
jgi:hypothetical protein